ncbi:YdcF family protein [Vagococcus carniphilus]|uniref:YdcF family protein n=1 Tax=Vagococcus carniphilus TaxID=218144 RepID=UPI0028917132|nr:YdcF family protein [Vagococcus carniphilus]MDT2814292.1 YdcF family protein [Vagococcus carniphilus]MDT2864479.1 YdcF family protein [Vagococcus carniphilus]
MGLGLIWFVIAIIVPLVCFLYWIYFRPTSLWTGFFFIMLVGSLYTTLIIQSEKISTQLAIGLAMPGILFLLITGIFGLFTGVIALFWNERILLKREGFSLSNLLPLLVALGLIAFQVMTIVLAYYLYNPYIITFSMFINMLFFYVISLFFFYMITSFLYNVFPIFGKVDYIIVLGAGLIDGERVTPLLASRIDIAVKLFNSQKNKKNHEPTIILSGGQGPDEKISEAQAMMNYVEEKNYQLGAVYLEEKAKNTKENLLLSEAIAYQKDSIKNFNRKNIVIASNNYHILRAGKLGYQAGISARGIGAKTKLYYLPTAFIREYIGYLALTKKRHLIIFGGIFFISLLMLALQLFVS